MKNKMKTVLVALLCSGTMFAAPKKAEKPITEMNMLGLQRDARAAVSRRQYDRAKELIAEMRSRKDITPAQFCEAWKIEADLFLRQGKLKEARKLYADLLNVINPAEAAWGVKSSYVNLEEPQGFKWLRGTINGSRIPFTNKEKVWLWDRFAYAGYMALSPELIREGMRESIALGGRGGAYSHRLKEALSCFDDLETFPIDEKDVVFPDSIREFGTTMNDRVVRVSKDFGFDPVNSTEFLQKALDSGASRIIIDNVGKPWYTRQLQVRSNSEIIIEKGVKIHTDRTWERFKRGGIFRIVNVTNVVIKGESPNDKDVVVSQFHDLMDRAANCRNYGTSAFCIDNSINVAVKNMRIAETAEDALMFGGLSMSNRNMYFENLDLDSCFRQACSFCSCNRVFFKKVRFRNTAGAEPGAGIDLEPAEVSEGNASIYLYDCTFENNQGGGLLFSTSSQLPITLHAKRCVFEPQRHGALMVFIRIGPYLGRNKKVPGKAIFEDCVFKGYSDLTPVRVDGLSLLDLEFIRCKIIDTGRTLQQNSARDASAFTFWLNRDVHFGGIKDGHVEATVSFNDMSVIGYTNAPLFSFRNDAGHTSIRNLKGIIDFNGKKVDASKFKHIGPDNKLTEVSHDVPVAFLPPLSKPKKTAARPFAFRWDGAWYAPRPQVTYLFYGKKGKKAKLVFNYPNKLWRTTSAVVNAPSGATEEFPSWKQGENVLDIVFKEDGWHWIEPVSNNALVLSEGTDVVYFTGRGADRTVQIDQPAGYVGYFLVPANKECVFKVEGGSVVIRDAKGEVFGTFARNNRTGSAYAKLKSKSGKDEVWSFSVDNRVTVKFFQPFNGVWADSPDLVPSSGKDVVRSPVIKLEHKAAAEEKDYGNVKLKEFLAKNPAIKKIVADEMNRRIEWAKKGEFTATLKEFEAKIARMKATVSNEQQQKELADEEKNLPPLKERADMEKRILKMSADELERYAFCHAFAVIRGVYYDKGIGANFLRCLYNNENMPKKYPQVYWWIYKKDYDVYISWWVSEFGLGFRDFTLICDKDSKLDGLIVALEKYIGIIMPDDLKNKEKWK